MEEEVLWYLGKCLFAWCLGYVAGLTQTAIAKLVESAS